MKKIAPIIILVIVSVFLIFYRFSDIPKNLSFDEVEFAKLALSLQNKPYTPYSTLATGHSTLYFYVILASLKIFGITKFALRFPSAVFGILSIVMFYLVMKNVFSRYKNETLTKIIPFLVSFLLLTSHWFLNFARFSFEATFLLFLELTSIYCFLKSGGILKVKIQSRLSRDSISSFYLFISGLFAGLAFLSYIPGRIFFVLPLEFIVYKLVNSLTHKRFNNITIKPLLYFLIPFLIVITPLTIYLSTHVDTRIDQEFFLNNHQVSIPVKISGLWQNISSTALMFDIKGDVNGRQNYPNKPALNPLLGILFIVGLIIAIRQWKNDDNKLFLIYFLLSLFPALMTYPWENPSMLRTFTALPSVILFAGTALYELSLFILKRFSDKKKIVSRLKKREIRYIPPLEGGMMVRSEILKNILN